MEMTEYQEKEMSMLHDIDMDVDEIKKTLMYNEEEQTMGNGVNFTDAGVLSLLGNIGGYGGAYNRSYDCGVDTRIGNNVLYKEVHDGVMADRKDFCDANLDRANKQATDFLLRGQDNLIFDNKIDRQTAFLESNIADLKSATNQNAVKLASIELTTQKGLFDTQSKIAECCCDAKVAAAEAKGRDDLMNYKLDSLIANQEKASINAINSQYAKTRVFGCGVETTSCV